MAKRILSIILTMALLLSCVSGLTLFVGAGTESTYAKVDWTGAEGAVTTNLTLSNVNTNFTHGLIEGTTDKYGLKMTSHNTVFKLTLDDLGFTTEDEVAVSVEYYFPSASTAASTRFSLLFNKNSSSGNNDWSHTLWRDGRDVVADNGYSVNPNKPLTTDAVALHTFTVTGDEVTDMFDAAGINCIFWESTVDNCYYYIRSITIFDASELPAEPDYAYYDFIETVGNPYYPELTEQRSNGIEFNAAQTEGGEQAYYKVDSAYQWQEGDAAQTIALKLILKDGYTATTGFFAYEHGAPDAEGAARFANKEFTVSGKTMVFEFTDATLRNGLNSAGSFRFATNGDFKTFHDQLERVELHVKGVGACQHLVTKVDETTVVTPSVSSPGNTGDTVCVWCNTKVADGTPIPKLEKYAKIDFSTGTVVTTGATLISSIQGTSLTPVAIADTGAYGLKLDDHGTGFSFKVDQIAELTAAEVAAGTKDLAVSVEYYYPTTTTNNSSTFAFITSYNSANNRMFGPYFKFEGTTWDTFATNADEPLKKGELAVTTFTLGKGVNYTVAPGQWSATEKFDTEQIVDTENMANAIITGTTVQLRRYGGNATNATAYIKSITIFDAAELITPTVLTADKYIDFEGQKTNPYYDYTTTYTKGITNVVGTENWTIADAPDLPAANETHTTRQRFTYWHLRLDEKMAENETHPVIIKVYRKAGATATYVDFQYNDLPSTDLGAWSSHQLVPYDANGVATYIAYDASFRNQLNADSSIRIMDTLETRADVEGVITYTPKPEDDLSAIARIELDYLDDTECANYHANFTVENGCLVAVPEGQEGGYKAPSDTEDGYTGNYLCTVCGTILKAGIAIPKLETYAKLDFTTGNAVMTGIKDFSIADTANISIQPIVEITDATVSGLKLTGHNKLFKFRVNSIAGIDMAAIEAGEQELAITVEYYMPSTSTDGNTRLTLFWDDAAGTLDAANLKQHTIRRRGEATTHNDAGGGYYVNDMGLAIDRLGIVSFKLSPVEAKLLLTEQIGAYVWDMTDGNYHYIKSIAIHNANLLSEPTVEQGYAYMDYEGEALNSLYPEYKTPIISGLTEGASPEVHYKRDEAGNPIDGDPNTDGVQHVYFESDKVYYNYRCIAVDDSLLADAETKEPKKIFMRFIEKEGANLERVVLQYQHRHKDDVNNDGEMFSAHKTISFKDGVATLYVEDALFFNQLTGSSSIRLADLEYSIPTNNGDGTYTWGERYVGDDYGDIARVEVWDLTDFDPETDVCPHPETEIRDKVAPSLNGNEYSGGYTGDTYCTWCDEKVGTGESMPAIQVPDYDYAQIDFSTGSVAYKNTANLARYATQDVAPVEIPGVTGEYGIYLTNHNNGFTFDADAAAMGFTEDLINAGEEIAITVEYYLSKDSRVDNNTRLSMQIGSSLADRYVLFSQYNGNDWDAPCVNQGSALTKGAMNITTFVVGANTSYTGNFDGVSKTYESINAAKALLNGAEVKFLLWDMPNSAEGDAYIEANPEAYEAWMTANASSYETEEEAKAAYKKTSAVQTGAASSDVYIASITFAAARTLDLAPTQSNREYINFGQTVKEHPLFEQYTKPDAFGMSYSDIVEAGGDQVLGNEDDVTYRYFMVNQSKVGADQDCRPVVVTFEFKEDIAFSTLEWSYQGAKTASGLTPWAHRSDEIVDGKVQVVLEDAAFENKLNDKGSLRMYNRPYPYADGLKSVEVHVIADMTELKAALAKNVDLLYKTSASVKAYTDAKAAAQTVRNNPFATDAEVAQAVNNLNAAEAALVDCDHVGTGTKKANGYDETCLKDGKEDDTLCADCGYTLAVGAVIPKHDTKLINVKEPTCHTKGYTGDIWCNVCNTTAKKGEDIRTIPHTWDEGKVTTPATPDVPGVITYTCTVKDCGATKTEKYKVDGMLGDVDGNGEITSTDARLALQYYVKKITGEGYDMTMADVDGNGEVTSTDARMILQYYVKKIDQFPASK